MTAESQSTKWIQQSLAGDLTAFAQLLEQPDLVLKEARTPMREYTLSADGVRTVLAALQEGEAKPGIVQHWASFMRRGYIDSRHNGPVQPVDIQHEPGSDQEIADILLCLDEIGDAVDGDVSPAEIAKMLATLARP